MRLHLFNPEHDLALASGKPRFTAPHAARQLRADLAFIPAFWAAPGDAVLVADAAEAREKSRRIVSRLARMGIEVRVGGSFVEPKDVAMLYGSECMPWGWDRSVCAAVRGMGIAVANLPTEAQLAAWRDLSHRRLTMQVLGRMGFKGMVGESVECATQQAVEDCMIRWRRMVIKAPWSSSGRGVRFVDEGPLSDNLRGWIRNTLAQQGTVMVEPYYNKVKDFGMEFMIGEEGSVRYCGLSLFSTTGSAYTGNILASESLKERLMQDYLSLPRLRDIQWQLEQVLAELVAPVYRGPVGVDMMIVAGARAHSFRIHPCVEVNLRFTMGHLALALSPSGKSDVQAVMNICFDKNHYHLRVTDCSEKTFQQHVSSIHDAG